MQKRPERRLKEILLSGIGKNKNISRKVTLNGRLLIFFFFLLLSVILWFLTALNKEYNTDLYYPVSFIRFPEGKALINDMPVRLQMNVKSQGYTLLKYKLKARLAPIVFDVNSFSLNTVPGKSASYVYILTEFAKEKIQQQMTSEIEILSISPDTLVFRFADKVNKWITIHPDIQVEFQKQFMQVGPVVLQPDSILVSGPASVLDTLKFILTEPAVFTGVNTSINKTIKLNQAFNLTYSISEVSVNVPVDKYTEASFSVPIEVINVPDSLNIKTFPGSVEITYLVGLSDYGNINQHMFRAEADFLSIENNIGTKLQVNLVKSPEFVKAILYYPKNVEYILEK
ncbi:MAG: YbbR-like domain-containing protein [Bacteroidales bacterium]|nr:YbbR-like domain-containing protein [Bacteroidales bacterium]